MVRNGYKQTEIGIIPDDWEVVPIGSIATFSSGFGISVATLSRKSSDTPIPVYGGNGIAGYTSKSLVKEPIVVVGRVGQKCGEVYLTTGPAWITDNALYPRTMIREVDMRFLGLALEAAGLNDVKNRNDLPLVTQSILHSVRIPIPSTKAEQKTIAAALFEVDKLIAGLDKLIAKKRAVKQAAMQQLLTGKTRLPGFGNGRWVDKPLGDIAGITMGQSPSSSFYNEKGNGLPLIQGNADVKNRKAIIRNYTSQITKRCQKGDIILSVRAPVGEVAKTDFDACIGRGVCAISYPNEFLYHYLIYLEPQWSRLSKGSTFDSVNSDEVRALEIHLPNSTEEQLAIAQILSNMDTEIAALEARRAKTQAIKQGMMQELLTGRTRLL